MRTYCARMHWLYFGTDILGRTQVCLCTAQVSWVRLCSETWPHGMYTTRVYTSTYLFFICAGRSLAKALHYAGLVVLSVAIHFQYSHAAPAPATSAAQNSGSSYAGELGSRVNEPVTSVEGLDKAGSPSLTNQNLLNSSSGFHYLTTGPCTANDNEIFHYGSSMATSTTLLVGVCVRACDYVCVRTLQLIEFMTPHQYVPQCFCP